MKLALQLLVVALLVFGLGAWLRHIYVAKNQTASVALAPSVATTSQRFFQPVNDIGPVTIEGTAIMDASSGIPAVPYISYFTDKMNLATKQLIFADERGCLPGAGDIPCVPSYPVLSAYPQLQTGQHISVTGYIRENRFIVTSLSVES